MRLRRTIKYNEKTPLLVLMDELYDKLDERMSRTIFGAVEIPMELEDMDKVKQGFLAIKETFGGKKKFHFMDLDTFAQSKIIEIISSMNIRCKMYVFYAMDISESDMKTKALSLTIKDTRKALSKQHVLNIVIENAEQYGRIIRARNLTSDDIVTIIPDAFCYAFARRLDAKMTSNWYNALCNKIRTEIYHIDSSCAWKMREDRLSKL